MRASPPAVASAHPPPARCGHLPTVAFPQEADSELSSPEVGGHSLEAGLEFITPVHPLTNWSGFFTSYLHVVIYKQEMVIFYPAKNK